MANLNLSVGKRVCRLRVLVDYFLDFLHLEWAVGHLHLRRIHRVVLLVKALHLICLGVLRLAWLMDLRRVDFTLSLLDEVRVWLIRGYQKLAL